MTRSASGLLLLALALAAAPSAQIAINEVLYDPPGATGDLSGDANGDGTRSSAEDEFIEIVNAGPAAVDISGYTLSDDDATGGQRFSFPAGTTLGAGQAAILFGGGTPTGTFGGAQTFVDDGTIGTALSNNGDIIELRDAAGALVSSVAYGSAGSVTGGTDQSIARNPDVAGDFVDHTTITTNDVLFSAGLQNATGAAFGSTGGGGSGALVVTTSADEDATNGQCSLREAVRTANGEITGGDCGTGADDGDRITFAATVITPIVLTMGEITITDDVSIDGSSLIGRVTVDANGQSRVFNISADTDDVSFTSLVLRNGNSGMGGSAAPDAGGAVDLKSGASATFTNVDVLNSVAGANGGGIHGAGNTDITITGGLVARNMAVEGGGLWSSGTITVTGTAVARNTATGNDADQGGGGFYSQGATATFTSTIFEDNRATGASGSGGNVLVNGGSFTMTGGELDEGRANRAGGGIEVASGTVRLDGVSVWMNDAGSNPGNGGGLHAGANTDVTVFGIRMSENTAVEGGGLWSSGVLAVDSSFVYLNVATGADADQGGGGFYNQGGRATVTRSEFMENRASGASGSGGGILNNMGMLTVRGTLFEENRSNRAGGAIEDRAGATSAGSMVSLTNVVMIENNAGSNPGNGGALHITGAGRVMVDSSRVIKNIAVNEGGGLWNSGLGSLEVQYTSVNGNTAAVGGGVYQQDGDGGALIFRNGLMAGNDASVLGGGLAADGATVLLVNSTISKNKAPVGAGAASRGSRVLISSATVAANRAGTAGGGLANLSADFGDGDDSDDAEADSSALSLDNTIVDENQAPIGPNLFGPIMSRGYNLFESTSGATVTMSEGAGAGDDIVGVDGGLLPLADNGGPTLTHALADDSPAINAGRTALEIDQRGVVRRGTPDIGAFESDAAPTADENFAADFADGETMRMSPVAPNPLRGSAELTLAVRESQTVRVMLYDVMGRQVSVLHDGPMAASTAYDLTVDARGLASGVYIVVVRGESIRGTQQITVVR